MDFSTLKDVNNVKAWLMGIVNDTVAAVKSIKNVNKDNFKAGFDKYFVKYLQESYAKFDGRVSRREYWMFAVYSILIGIAISIVCTILPFLSVLSIIYVFALLVPSIGLGVRRLHDVDLSGWWFLIAVVPFIGGIALVLLFATLGDKGSNRFDTAAK